MHHLYRARFENDPTKCCPKLSQQTICNVSLVGKRVIVYARNIYIWKSDRFATREEKWTVLDHTQRRTKNFYKIHCSLHKQRV